MKWMLFLILPSLFLLCDHTNGATLESAQTASISALLRSEGSLSFCGEPVPTDEQEVKERFEKELLLALENRAQVILWLKRSRRYLPYIEKSLRERQMPDDLKYVAFAESALLPHAGSSKGAVGYWQFIPPTGRKYGLTIDARTDERRNIYSSTQAALRYFKELHETFHSWTLAAAAYNMGEDRLMAEILEQGTDNYYHLYLPLETQRFLFRILSVKLILSKPEKYGFHLAEGEYYPPAVFDVIELYCDRETPIRIVAEAAGTHFKAIKDLNPQIRGHYLSIGNHRLLIPKGAAAAFPGRYSEALAKHVSTLKGSVYIVKKGDNLSTIAERFDVPLFALVLWNNLDVTRPIHPGDRLLIRGKSVTRGETQEGQTEQDTLLSED
ncbi:MAG: transglycosylase SLT domain-containing protein [Deltaproteobacteria bacterium]|nr:transglycosylase SLT domain-containing protein [Deltaproteobacteria bacterium]